jgi:peptide/nickel transport system ATP-binding protein
MPSAGLSGPLLEVEDVSVYFGRSRAAASGLAAALEGVSIAIQRGVSVGVVGESGSGKTTLLRVLAGLVRPQRGVVRHDGKALDIRHRDSARAFRADVQLVFQDPAGSLDPRQKVWELVSEPAWALTGIRSRERHALTESLLARLGLPTEYADRRPHQLSGGERQRVALARALSSHPKVILLDEPVASLDASRRGQVINLLNDLGREDGVTFVVVSHDIVPVALLTDTMVAMYRGRIVEAGPTRDVLRYPAHPYTRLLAESVRDPLYGEGTDDEIREALPGSCAYSARCPDYRETLCDISPSLKAFGPSREVACHVRIAELKADVGIRTSGEELRDDRRDRISE